MTTTQDPSVENDEDLLAGGRYQIIRQLGRGAQGRTLLARELQTGDEVAIKTLDFGQIDQIKALELFEREARVLGEITVAGVPRYLDYFSEEGARGELLGCYLVQEYIAGENLRDLVRQGRLFTEREVQDFLTRLLDILENLHAEDPPLVHRDIKPSNIIRRADGQGYALVDFGAVGERVIHGAGSSTVVGTSGYAPLEQLMGRALPASDLYALGASAIYLLSHTSPSELYGPGQALLFRDYVHISDEFADFLERLCAVHVEDRIKSAALAQHYLRALSQRAEVSRRQEQTRFELEHVARSFEQWPALPSADAEEQDKRDSFDAQILAALGEQRVAEGNYERGGDRIWRDGYAVIVRSTASGRAGQKSISSATFTRGAERFELQCRRALGQAEQNLGWALLASVFSLFVLRASWYAWSVVGWPSNSIDDLSRFIGGFTASMLFLLLAYLAARSAVRNVRRALAEYFKPTLKIQGDELHYLGYEFGRWRRVKSSAQEIDSVGVIFAMTPQKPRGFLPFMRRKDPDYSTPRLLMEVRLRDEPPLLFDGGLTLEDKTHMMGELREFLSGRAESPRPLSAS